MTAAQFIDLYFCIVGDEIVVPVSRFSFRPPAVYDLKTLYYDKISFYHNIQPIAVFFYQNISDALFTCVFLSATTAGGQANVSTNPEDAVKSKPSIRVPSFQLATGQSYIYCVYTCSGSAFIVRSPIIRKATVTSS